MYRELAALIITSLFVTGLTSITEAQQGVAVGVTPEGRTVGDGIFTAEQAARGHALAVERGCVFCHENGGTSGTAPRLTGAAFLSHWRNRRLTDLFFKMRDGMPPGYPDEVADEKKIDILAYLLQENGFPPGPNPLVLDRTVLDSIEISASRDRSSPQNFALVDVVGCLARQPENGWVLTGSSEPISAIAPPRQSMGAAVQAAAGTAKYTLVNVNRFQPATHVGQRMMARGLLYSGARETLLNLTSLQLVGSSC